jgi:hypothetical protein
VAHADTYEFQMARDAAFTDLFSHSVTAGSVVTVHGLPRDGQIFYWRVRAGNSGSWSPYSAAFRMLNGTASTTGGSPLGTELVYPPDNGYQPYFFMYFSWKPVAGATAYELQIARDQGFVDLFAERTLGNVSVVTVGDLPRDGTVFYWRVRASNGSAWGAYSTPFTMRN